MTDPREPADGSIYTLRRRIPARSERLQREQNEHATALARRPGQAAPARSRALLARLFPALKLGH